jgi:hypothetical protein
MIMIRKIALPLLLISIFNVAFSAGNKTTSKPFAETGFAVVELFTSEGCSSCPPADALLAEIAKESQNKSVYLLAFHVDYWDRLGWMDRFSSPKFSARQNQYANWLNLKTIYTPQVVINGGKEFVGSEENIMRNSIKTALAKPTGGNLQISLGKTDKHRLILNYTTDQQADGFSLAVALVSSNASSQVLKGENKGKTLAHVQIVRQFEAFALQGKTKGSVDMQVDKVDGKVPTELIAFLQNNKTGKIIAASKLNNLFINHLTNKSE